MLRTIVLMKNKATSILVVGASRGVGLEFVRQYRAEGSTVTATARDDAGLARLRALGATAFALDVTNATHTGELGALIEGAAFDIVLHVAGVFGPRLAPLQTPAQADFDHVMHANVLGPMRVLPQLAGALAPGAKVVLLSSRMGSIGQRAAANASLYRASKAALNSYLKDLSITWQDKATSVVVHPGWVKTDMGGSDADLEVADSVASLRRVIAGLTPAQNGSYLDVDGTPLAW